MKILILANNDGGLYQFRKEILESLIRNHHEVICCVPDEEGFIEKIKGIGCKWIDVSMNRRSINPISDAKLLLYYRKLIRHERPDVVLAYTIKPNVYGGIICRINHTPFFPNITGLGTTIENGGLLAAISLTLYRIGLKKANCVFFQNSQNMNLFQKKRIVGENTCLIPGSGVNVDNHKLEDYPLQDTLFRFLFVGRVMKDKGIEELLQTINLLGKDGEAVFLDVVGECDEDYSELLSRSERQGTIKYHGLQSNVHQFYTNAHCVVLPSYHEGMANVMLEAASTGRPVITCNIPGCMETFDEGKTGFGCMPKDVNSLKNAMKRMIDTPWETRKQMGLAGREKVKREFDRKIIINSYLEHISSTPKN